MHDLVASTVNPGSLFGGPLDGSAMVRLKQRPGHSRGLALRVPKCVIVLLGVDCLAVGVGRAHEHGQE